MVVTSELTSGIVALASATRQASDSVFGDVWSFVTGRYWKRMLHRKKPHLFHVKELKKVLKSKPVGTLMSSFILQSHCSQSSKKVKKEIMIRNLIYLDEFWVAWQINGLMDRFRLGRLAQAVITNVASAVGSVILVNFLSVRVRAFGRAVFGLHRIHYEENIVR
jgi:hypothetical protein